jgi:TolB-like protein
VITTQNIAQIAGSSVFPLLQPDRSGLLQERRNGVRLVIKTIEYDEQFCHDQQVFHSLADAQQVDVAASPGQRDLRRNQFTKSGAVNRIDLAEIENEPAAAFIDETADGVSEQVLRLTTGHPAAHINDCDLIDASRLYFESHLTVSFVSQKDSFALESSHYVQQRRASMDWIWRVAEIHVKRQDMLGEWVTAVCERGSDADANAGDRILLIRGKAATAMSDYTVAGARRFRFGQFDVDARSGELRRQGLRIKLQDRPFQVLLLLLERPGEIVTREEIERRLWPDTIVEFETNLNAAVKRLREALDDSADNPRFIETIPRKGYRFIATEGLQKEGNEGPREISDPSMAVLPFRDRSPDRDQEYFCDGITEELTDALAKVQDLRVVSRTSTFQYKGRTEDVRKIGAELEVGALLEGSVRKAEERLRITVHLTSVRDGCHIWSQSYECESRDVFDIQDQITGDLVRSLTEKLGWGVSYARGPRLILSKPSLTKDLVAYDLYLKGLYYSNQRDESGIRKSIEFYRQAIARDQDYALAHAALAEAYMSIAAMQAGPVQQQTSREAARNEVDTYLRLIQENYEQKQPR